MTQRKTTAFSWLRHPQLFLVGVISCLLIGASGAVAQTRPLPPVPTVPRPVALRPTPPINCSVERCLAITFDDGPSPYTTPQMLDILAAEQVHATFFLVGRHVPGQGKLLQRMHTDGHEIGNHSWSHPDLTTLAPSEVHAQVYTTQAAIIEAGVPAPQLMRPPYGATNAMVESHIPLTIVRWNIDPEDWLVKNPDELAQRIVAQVKPGGILLLHDTHPQTVEAVRKVLPQLKNEYKLVTVSQLMGLSGGDRGQYFGR